MPLSNLNLEIYSQAFTDCSNNSFPAFHWFAWLILFFFQLCLGISVTAWKLILRQFTPHIFMLKCCKKFHTHYTKFTRTKWLTKLLLINMTAKAMGMSEKTWGQWAKHITSVCTSSLLQIFFPSFLTEVNKFDLFWSVNGKAINYTVSIFSGPP